MSKKTREEWLSRLVDEFRPDFKKLDKPLPDKIRCSVGFPFGKRKDNGGSETVGECWAATAAKDKKPQVFVSPTQADPLKVAAIIVHELVHACGIRGHKADFRAVGTAMGLVGKMTHTTAGPELDKRLSAIIKKLGPYDHAELNPEGKGGPKKQGTRLIKVMCPKHEYPARVTQKWIDDMGFPSCPCGEEMVLGGDK